MGMMGQGNRHTTDEDLKVYQWIAELMQGGNRETALLELSKKREQVDDLALILWHSVGMILVLSLRFIQSPHICVYMAYRQCKST
jgi:hypothetical protein